MTDAVAVVATLLLAMTAAAQFAVATMLLAMIAAAEPAVAELLLAMTAAAEVAVAKLLLAMTAGFACVAVVAPTVLQGWVLVSSVECGWMLGWHCWRCPTCSVAPQIAMVVAAAKSE